MGENILFYLSPLPSLSSPTPRPQPRCFSCDKELIKAARTSPSSPNTFYFFYFFYIKDARIIDDADKMTDVFRVSYRV